jgi:hypothetical protein
MKGLIAKSFRKQPASKLAVLYFKVFMSNFAVVVAPLHTKDYIDAMKRLTELQKEGFTVSQRNVIIMYDDTVRKELPFCIYWLEKPLEVS